MTLRAPLCFLAALFFLYPHIREYLDLDARLPFLLSLPAVGLGYMGVFFHEVGHCLTGWIFGYPGIPTFDFAHGGGMAYHGERTWLVALIAPAGLAYLVFWLWRQDARHEIPFVAVPLALVIPLTLTSAHEAAQLYMGHGAEILIGGFCLWRALSGRLEGKKTEEILHLVFGFYLLLGHAAFCLNLMLSEVGRMAYHAQKGGHGFGDFSRIADMAGGKIETVAGISLTLTLGVFATAVIFGLRARQEHRE